jgi:hypothetical protein
VDRQAKQSGPVYLHSTDAECGAFARAVNKAITFYNLNVHLQSEAAGKPIIIYEDSQPCIDTILSNTISSKAKRYAVYIAFTHEQISKGICKPEKIDTKL